MNMGIDLGEAAMLVGQESGAIRALDAVSKSDIRHWCELLGDADPDYHEKIKRGEKTAPPAMTPVWSMDALWPPREAARGPHEELADLFDAAGYTGAAGVGLDQEFLKPIAIGDRLSFKVTVLEISSGEEQTRLGKGYLVRLLYTFVNQDGDVVSTQTHSVLRYENLEPQLD
jgi:hypothetical protein